MTTPRIICGTHTTQAVARDQEADFAEALRGRSDYDALMYLHGLGYDCSQARVLAGAR
jgi:hypothetical protein